MKVSRQIRKRCKRCKQKTLHTVYHDGAAVCNICGCFVDNFGRVIHAPLYKKVKERLCQICEKRPATVGFNCKPCNDGIKQRDEARSSSSSEGYGGWGHDE